MDSKETVGELKGLVAEFIRERDWEKYHNPKDLAVGIGVEAGELMEIFLWEDFKPKNLDGQVAARAKEELADIAIYCLSFAVAQGWDLSDMIRSKIEKNKTKYPAKKYKGRAHVP